MNEKARAVWARTRLLVWPDPYVLASLRSGDVEEAAALATHSAHAFAAVIVERDEVSLTIREDLWRGSGLEARELQGPFRAITLDVDIDLDVCGYLAPAATRLAEAGVAIVPQCAFLKDHILVHERDLAPAVTALEMLIREAARNTPG
jgi:hypothetical protein